MKKRILFAIIAMVLLLTVMGEAAPVNATVEDEINAFTYYYDCLNEQQKSIYVWMKSFFDSKVNESSGQGLRTEYTIDLIDLMTAPFTEDNFLTFYEDIMYAQMALQADDPSYEMIGQFFGGGWSQSGEPHFNVNYVLYEITDDMRARIDARLEQLVAVAGDGDRYTQLRRLVTHLYETAFYDPYLGYADQTAYTHEYFAERGNHYDHTAAGLLLEGIAVCDGFSDSFKMICNELGIPCIIMGNASHAWNLVQMEDGKWYRVDITNLSRLGWDHTIESLEYYFEYDFLRNDTFSSVYNDPYMCGLDGVPLVTEFPEHAQEQYRYTGTTTDFSFTVPESSYMPAEPTFLYRVNDGGMTCTIIHYEGPESGDLIIPESLDGFTVSAIGPYAFYYCSGFTGKLVLPDAVKIIERSAFLGCYGLTSVEFSASLQQIDNGAFAGCKGLTELTLPDLLDTIDECVFFDCNNLHSITFGMHIQNIEKNAFEKIGVGVSADKIMVGPAGSVVSKIAATSGFEFREEGTLCAVDDENCQWGFVDEIHFRICEHGARLGFETHVGEYCGWKCSDCGAEFCLAGQEYVDKLFNENYWRSDEWS